MLTLTRRLGEAIRAGEIVIVVKKISGNRVVIGVDAPASVRIVRGEVSDAPPSADERNLS